MANRHKMSCKKAGGAVYSGSGSNVVKEAKSNANYKSGGKVAGEKAKARIKKAGGGATSNPWSSAHRG